MAFFLEIEVSVSHTMLCVCVCVFVKREGDERTRKQIPPFISIIPSALCDPQEEYQKPSAVTPHRRRAENRSMGTGNR